MAHRQQQVRAGILDRVDLAQFGHDTLQIDPQFMADTVERRDDALLVLLPHAPQVPGNQQRGGDHQGDPAGNECVELRLTHSELPSNQPSRLFPRPPGLMEHKP